MDRQEWLGLVENLGLKYMVADQSGEIRAVFARKDDAERWIAQFGSPNGWAAAAQVEPRFWKVPQ